MSYKTTVDYVRYAANTVLDGAGSFLHGRRIDLTLQSVDTVYPLVYLAPIDGKIDKELRFASNSVIVSCWSQDRPDANPDELEELIEAMYQMCMEIHGILAEDKAIQVDEVNLWEPHYQFYQGTVSGVSIRFTMHVPVEC